LKYMKRRLCEASECFQDIYNERITVNELFANINDFFSAYREYVVTTCTSNADQASHYKWIAFVRSKMAKICTRICLNQKIDSAVNFAEEFDISPCGLWGCKN